MQTGRERGVEEQNFVARSPSGHAIPIDPDRASNKAPAPMEFVLLALGACTATDVVIILEKKRQKLESLEVICSGERAAERSEEHTSELQSRLHLVCRLLLEKKKK